jgi:anti-anti-sigma factor
MAADLQDPQHNDPYASTQLRVTVREDAELLVVQPRGEIDMAAAPALYDQLLMATNECSQPVVIDLSGVTFMDSTGLDMMIRTQRLLSSKGLPLRIRNARDTVRRVFDITGTTALFDLDG